jgi:fructose-1,6-bisphosphatase/inositol monophosphatase family enzyme
MTTDALRMSYRGTGSPLKTKIDRGIRGMITRSVNHFAFPKYTKLAIDPNYRGFFKKDVDAYGTIDERVEQINFDFLEKENFGGLVFSEEWLKKYGEPREFESGSGETRNDVIVKDPIEGSTNAENKRDTWGSGATYIKNGRLLVEEEVDSKDPRRDDVEIVYTCFYQPNKRLIEANREQSHLTNTYGSKVLSVNDNPMDPNSVHYNWWQREEERQRNGFMEYILNELGRTDQIRTFSDWIDLSAIATGETPLTCFTFTEAWLHDMLAVHIVEKAGGVVYHGDNTPVDLLEHLRDNKLRGDLIAAVNDDIAMEVFKKRREHNI